MTRIFCEKAPAWSVGKGDSVYLRENGRWELHPVSWYIRGTGEFYTTLVYEDGHENTRHSLHETLLIFPRLERKVICDNCGKIIKHDDAITIGNLHYCDAGCAFESEWVSCDVCGEWVLVEQIAPFWSGNGDEWICEDCAEKLSTDLIPKQDRIAWCETFNAYVTHHHCCGCPEKHHVGCGRGRM